MSGRGTCAFEGCGRSARYEFFIAGLPTFDRYGREQICKRCADEMVALFAEMALSEESIVGALEDIRSNASKRVDAIDYLRSVGYSPDAIAQAVKGVAERLPVEQILEVLAGEREAVAA